METLGDKSWKRVLLPSEKRVKPHSSLEWYLKIDVNVETFSYPFHAILFLGM